MDNAILPINPHLHPIQPAKKPELSSPLKFLEKKILKDFLMWKEEKKPTCSLVMSSLVHVLCIFN